jgi:hypothetical protein
MSVPDEGYSRNVPDEGYSRNVPDEGYSSLVEVVSYLLGFIQSMYLQL